ncbi:MAG: hypothetical protein R3Y54_10735, partial [Eubacteriales bacterium]
LHNQIETIEQNNGTITGQQSKIQKGNTQLEKVANKKAKIVNIDSVEIKPTILDKSKITVDKAEFENIKLLAQKQVVSVSNVKKQKTEIKELKEENQVLRNINTQQYSELSEFKSVRSKLGANEDKMRIEELEKFQNVVYKFLDKLGVRKQFEDFMKMFRKQRNEVKR